MDPVLYFTGKHPCPPRREDGTIDYECLCGEFLIEGASFAEVNAQYDRLHHTLRRPEPGTAKWYRKRADEVRHNKKVVSQYNHFLGIAEAMERVTQRP